MQFKIFYNMLQVYRLTDLDRLFMYFYAARQQT